MSKVVIIGGVAAGMKAAATAHRRRPDLDIVVLQEDAEVSYSACGLPYYLGAPDVIQRSQLIARTVDRFRSDGIDLRAEHRVEEVDITRGTVRVRSTSSGKLAEESFDQLLFATGARAIVPKLEFASGAPPVLPLRSLRDADAMMPFIRSRAAVSIIGGGYVGLELAEALVARGMLVTVVEAMDRLLPAFEPVIGQSVVASLVEHGVRVVTGNSAVGLSRTGLLLADGSEIPADLVVTAIGVRPNVELAAASGIKVGETGAIVVDDGMRSNVDHVFAAGDCVESRHQISGDAVWYPLGDIANRQGRVAGENLAGGHSRFPGVLGTAIFKLFDYGVGRTGLSDAQATAAGFNPVRVNAQVPSRARYMPDSRMVNAWLSYDAASGRVLGGEAVGGDAVDKFIDVVATASWAGMTYDDLAELDLAYAPPFSPVFSTVQVLGELARKE